MAVSTESGASFVSPRFAHREACACKAGFAGARCDVVLNECALEPCPSFKVCVPDGSFQVTMKVLWIVDGCSIRWAQGCVNLASWLPFKKRQDDAI